MELTVERNRMIITPENEMEEAYLEEVFKLKVEGEEIKATRINAMGLGCWAYLEIK